MAIGQNLSTNLYCPNSSQYPFVLSVSWSETGTNVGGNVSYISASGSLSGQYVAFDGAPYTSYLELYWYDDRTNSNTLIGRSAFTSCGMGYGTRTVTGTAQPSHKNDGTLNGHVWVRFSAGSGSGGWSPASKDYGGSNVALTTIPRQSSITSVSGSNLGSGVTVNISRNSSSFTHKVWYSFNGSEWYAVTSSAATSATFTPPLSLGSRIPNSTSGTLTVYVDTMNGSTKIGNTISKSIALSMPSSVIPSMGNPTASRVDNGVPSSWGIYVKNKSKVTISIPNSSGAYGSSISSYSITGPNLSSGSSSATSGVLTSSGTLTYTCRVTDSRGRSVSKTVSISVVDYYNPSLKVSADRCNSSGVITGDGTYLRVVVDYGYSSVSGKNSISSKSVTCNGVSNTTFGDNAAFTLAANCSIGSKYTLTATVRDALGNSASASVEIPTAARIINIRQNKKGIAFGKFSERDAFEVAMPSHFEKPVRLLLGTYVHRACSGAGTAGWLKIAEFKIENTYINNPIKLTISQKTYLIMYDIYIIFNSTNNLDPTLASFIIDNAYSPVQCYIYKSSTSTWDLYIKKGYDSYENICVTGLNATSITEGHISVSWLDSLVTSLPSGGTYASYYGFTYLDNNNLEIHQRIRSNNAMGTWIKGRENATIRNLNSPGQSWAPGLSMKTVNGSWEIGTLGDSLWFSYTTDSNYNANTNVSNRINIGNDLSIYGEPGLRITASSLALPKQTLNLSGTVQGSTITLYLTRYGDAVEGTIHWTGTSGTNTMMHFTSLYIPAGWRPRFYVWFNAVHVVGSSIFDETKTTRYRIGPDGVFTCITNEGSNVERHATVSWIAYQ